MISEQPMTDLFLDNLTALPLWVKQILYLKIGEELKEGLSHFMKIFVNGAVVQYYIPDLTFAGRQENERREKKLPNDEYIFLKKCYEGNTLFEISIANYWTFAQTCKYFVNLMDMELVQVPDDKTILYTVQFLAGKIRTGEILEKLGMVDPLQVEEAVRVQKEKLKYGENVKIAEVMINLGLINKDDVKILLAFKDDANRRFVMGVGFSLIKPKNQEEARSIISSMQREMKRLDEENKILKNRLRKFLNIKQ